ncbi:uncharacterized protein LOC115976445 [Quercus lobata]|uniref:uncharacterized protein LOC115976445 n=1 Tax=Quercus lobata TaxID=97700 RepID=UPI0012449731|nr:uncharacterized protein LOC115976445 [Quercus lobata]XP_030953587.1 uncharacterized protein LOC115976445 [Quercus lobata]
MEHNWVKLRSRAHPEYRQGVKDFLDFAFEHTTMGNKIFCPCKRCNNYFAKTRDDVEGDLLTIGILPSYTRWFRHGEERRFETCDSLNSDDESDEDGLSEMEEDYCAAFKATSCIAGDSSGNGTPKGKKKRKKRGRGPTRNLKLSKEFKGGEKYEISWLNGRPVGPHARVLINECTKLVREQENVPLKFTDWKKVPDINKRKLFDKVLEYFKVEGREKEVWRQMGNSYSNYRDFLKTNWFKPYGEATEEARANVPPGVERDDWNCLVDLWTNKDYMDMCLINKNNRSKNDIVHTSGSKSFQQRSAEEKEKTGHDPTRVQLFDVTHVQPNGQAVNEPTQDALMALRNLTAQVNEGALHMSQDQMFTEVFGPERHGRVRGYGAGITPTKLKGSSSSIMHDLEKQLQESEQKRVEADAEANAKVDLLKGEVDQLKSMLEQQASQMAEQSRRFEDMMAQVMSCMTSQSAQSNRALPSASRETTRNRRTKRK